MQRLIFLFLLASSLLLSPLDSPAQLPPPSPAAPLFKDRPFGPRPCPTPTPERKKIAAEKKPIPREWIVAGIVAAGLATVALLYGSVRRWRSSALFRRQYRFLVPEEVAERFGARKCGGHLVTVSFGPKTSP